VALRGFAALAAGRLRTEVFRFAPAALRFRAGRPRFFWGMNSFTTEVAFRLALALFLLRRRLSGVVFEVIFLEAE
jgi:hypothetical protein